MLCGLIYPSEGSIIVAGYLPFRRKEKTLEENNLNNGSKTTTNLGSSSIESFYLNASIYDLDKFEAKEELKNYQICLKLILSFIYLLENYLG